MTSTFLSKKILIKFIAVVTSVMLVLCLAPISNVFSAMSKVKAETETPVYDSSLGSYTESNGVLTATPNANAGFRGWFKKDGTEVSYNTTYTLPSGANAADYVPVFYDFNLVKNGGFEEYAPNTNLKSGVPADEIWEGVTDTEAKGEGGDWTKSIVSNNRARTGSKSLALTSFHNCSYKDFTGLEPNTQYTLTYYFNIDADTSKYMKQTYVVNGDVTESQILAPWNLDSKVPTLAKRLYGATDGVCAAGEWKKVKMTFFTGDNTSVKLLIYYHDGSNSSPLYIDDVSLVKDVLASPNEYFKDDFATGSVSNHSSLDSHSTLSASDGKLSVTVSTKSKGVQYAPFFAKKGVKYDITFRFNFGTMGATTDTTNYMNFSLTNTKGRAFEQGVYIQNFKGEADFKAIISQGGTQKDISNWYDSGKYSNTCCVQNTLTNEGFNTTQDIAVTLSITPANNTLVYLNTWINGTGTYTVDDLSVTETVLDSIELVSQSAVKSLGTAIRTEGKQGMRFKTQIDKRLLTSDMYYGIRVVEYGTVAIKTAYRGDAELVLDGMYSYGDYTYAPKYKAAYSFADKTDLVFAEDKTTIDFTGVLINIPEVNWTSDYTARAYFKYVDKNGNTGTFYCDPADIDVYNVSKRAYSAKDADGDYVESDSIREYLYTNIISKFSDKLIKVYNDSNPIYSNFEGIRSTIYHGVIFFPDSHGRTYTEAQAAVEMDRLVDTKVDNVRTRFDSHWMWTASGWDWNSTKMTAFYKWAKMLEDRDISITIQAGWHLYDFICFYNEKYDTGITDTTQDPDGDGHSSIPEVNYLHGYTDDTSAKATNIYGEDDNAAAIEADARALGLNLTDAEFAHYSVAAARYGEWITQGIEALKAKGLTNVEYVLPFTESGDVRTGDTTFSYDEWIIMTMGLNNALEDAGLRSSLKLIGPAQSIYANQNRLSLVEYIYSLTTGTEYADMIDINAMHQYTRPNYEAGYANTVYDPEASYSLADENFNYYNDVLTNSGVRDMEFWCDEYFANAPDAKSWNNVGMQMTQFAAGLTAGINKGVNRFLTWQMFDTLWDSDRTHGIGIHDNLTEFSGGIHAVGTCPSLVHVDGKTCPNGASCPCTANYNISSYVPRTTYYGINLIGKYMNNENAQVFATKIVNQVSDTDYGIYVSAIKNDEGKNVILVVNTTDAIACVDVEFENSKAINIDRYLYNPEEIVPTAEAKSISSDKTVSLVGTNTFRDTIPARSFAIYVESGNFNGDDIDIPIEFF